MSDTQVATPQAQTDDASINLTYYNGIGWVAPMAYNTITELLSGCISSKLTEQITHRFIAFSRLHNGLYVKGDVDSIYTFSNGKIVVTGYRDLIIDSVFRNQDMFTVYEPLFSEFCSRPVTTRFSRLCAVLGIDEFDLPGEIIVELRNKATGDLTYFTAAITDDYYKDTENPLLLDGDNRRVDIVYRIGESLAEFIFSGLDAFEVTSEERTAGAKDCDTYAMKVEHSNVNVNQELDVTARVEYPSLMSCFRDIIDGYSGVFTAYPYPHESDTVTDVDVAQ